MKRNTPWCPANMRVGMWAFVLHRVTGLALVGYLLLHIMVISTSLAGGLAFDAVLARLQAPLFLVLDLGLVAAVLLHGLNGLRLLLFDLGVGIRRQKELFWSAVALGAVGFGYAVARVAPVIAERL